MQWSAFVTGSERSEMGLNQLLVNDKGLLFLILICWSILKWFVIYGWFGGLDAYRNEMQLPRRMAE